MARRGEAALLRHDRAAWARNLRNWADRMDERAARAKERAEELREAAEAVERGEAVELFNMNGVGPERALTV